MTSSQAPTALLDELDAAASRGDERGEILREWFHDLETSLDEEDKARRVLIGALLLETHAASLTAAPAALIAASQRAADELVVRSADARWVVGRYYLALSRHRAAHTGPGSALNALVLARELGVEAPRLETATILLRAGSTREATDRLSADHGTAALLLLAKAQRLRGDLKDAHATAERARIAAPLEDRDAAQVDVTLAEAISSGDLLELMRARRKRHGVEDPELAFTKHFLAALDPHNRYRSRLRTPDYLLRTAREAGILTPAIRELRDAAQALSETHDTSSPLHARAQRLLDLTQAPWVGDLEQRLQFLIAASAVLDDVGCRDASRLPLQLYRNLSLVLSDGQSSDALLLDAMRQQWLEAQAARAGSKTAAAALVGPVSMHVMRELGRRLSLSKRHSHAAKAALAARLSETLLREFQKRRGLFLKLYQLGWGVWLDMPPEVRQSIEEALYSTEVLPRTKVEGVLSKALGRPMAEVFSEWHDVPLGSGSFGQVHRARLVSGREVAVKVQYPDARECLLQDIQTISRAAPLFKTLYPQLEFDAFVKATRDAKLRELDYVGERRFMEDLAAALSDMRDIVIPRPVEGLCSDHVIVMDFLQGTPGLAFAETASAAERSVQAERIHRASLAQVVRLPEMNYEIHLGNFVFMPDALGICDFGCRTASTVDGYPAFFTGLGLTEANDVNGFELRARTQGFFPQGVAIDAAAVLKVQREVLFRPWLGEQPFKFTRHFVKDCFDVLSKVGPQAEAMRLPARMFAHSKFEWTLWSTLAELDASADWRASIAPLRDQLHGRKKAG